jgi:ASC-1-like (ASCH) protein
LGFGRGTVPHMDLDERQQGAPVDTVRIPDPLLLNAFTKDPVGDLIAFVYGAVRDEYKNPDYFRDRGIVTPLNVDVNLINDKVLALLPEQPFEFNAVNKLDEEENPTIWSPELLQSLEVPGFPQSVLRLTAYAVVMLIRNMSLRDGLVNGTRMQVLPGLGHNTQNVIKCRILTGSRAGSVVFIPRIVFEPTTSHLPFKFRRRQYPLRLCFGMTINKSQGQGFHRLGVYLPSPVFSHGQLYVALSRLIDPLGLRILIIPGVCQGRMSRTNPSYGYTRNVVLKAVFKALINGWISYTRSYIEPCSFMMQSAPFGDVCTDTKTVEVRLQKSVKYVVPGDVLTFGCGEKRVAVCVLSRENYTVNDPKQAESVLRRLLTKEGLKKVLPRVPNINHAIGAYIRDSVHGHQLGYEGIYKPDTVVKYNGFTALRIARIVNGLIRPSVVPPPPTTDSQILAKTNPAVVHDHPASVLKKVSGSFLKSPSEPSHPVPIPAQSPPFRPTVHSLPPPVHWYNSGEYRVV